MTKFDESGPRWRVPLHYDDVPVEAELTLARSQTRRASDGRGPLIYLRNVVNSEVSMLQILGFLLVLWLVFVVLGFVIKSLFWLAIVGAVLFVGTAGYAWVKREALRR